LPKIENGKELKLSLTKDVVLKPKETVSHDFGITLNLKDHHVGIVLGGKLIFNTFVIKISTHLLWTRDVPIQANITNLTEKEIYLTAQPIVSVYIINIKGDQTLKIETAKIILKTKKNPDVNGMITEKLAQNFLSAKIKNLALPSNQLDKTCPIHETENIFSQAALHPFSATSYMISVRDQGHSIFNIYAYENRAYTEGVNKKTYFSVYIKNFRVVACADSGSDLTLMQISLFKNIFPDYKKRLEENTNLTIKSYSDNQIKVFGQCKTAVKFEKYQEPVDLILTVIEDINESVPQFLFGNDSLRKTLALIAYTGDINNPEPEIVVQRPTQLVLKTYYTSPGSLFVCRGRYSLDPYECGEIDLFLHPAAPVIRINEILVKSYIWSQVQIMETKTDINFDENLNCFKARGFIVNLGPKHEKGTIEARFEVIETYSSYLICTENRSNLKRIMTQHPPVREILPVQEGNSTDVYNCHCTTVYNVQLEPTEPIPVLTEEELQSTAGIGKVSYTGTAEVGPQVIDGGLDLPTIIHKSPEEALNLGLYDPDIRPYIKKIFLDKYPEVIALHSLDSGDISKTLGYTTLRLIPGETLPRHRRIYQLSVEDSRYLEELLEHFIRFNFVRRAPVDSTNIHLYGMSTYLVPRKKPTDLARLVIDFSPLTSIIQSPPSIVPDIVASLQQLQGKALYTVMDLKYAYLALRISEESKPLTTFLTQGGAYQWLTIPTGAACSPAYFIDAINRILQNKPVLDKNGKPIFESKNKVKLEHDLLPNCFHYFDDILCSSEPKPTYKETLDHHFNCLDKIIYRLHFHGVKLSVGKSEFAKSRVLFLGWIVSHDYVMPDPRRLEKIKNAKFPESKKEVRSFLGLVNSIRRVIPFEVTEIAQVLTPLTSSTQPFLPEEKHYKAFEEIKGHLLREPLFCNLLRPDSTKLLWVDAASTSGCLGAVLAQQIQGESTEGYLNEHIDLEDKVHQVLYDRKLPYMPAKLYTSFPIKPVKITAVRTVPPKSTERDVLHGFTKENWQDSLFWSIISLMVLYNCKIPVSTLELRQMATKELKKGILAIKLKDLSFNNVHSNFRTYLQEFDAGQHTVDENLLLAQALANALHRCFIFVSSLQKHKERPVFKFNAESTKPPLIFGVYQHEEKVIFTPFFYNKNLEFNIDNLKGKVQIVAYLSKSVPKEFTSKPILDLEAMAILTALHSLQRYISNTRCYLLTDSRVLYYMFHQKIGESSTKIRRWVLKLISDYPQVTLHFIRTSANLADYLTRQGLPPGDLQKLNLKTVGVQDFYDILPKKEFSLTEWIKFCTDNPQYLTVNTPTVNLVNAFENTISHIEQSSKLDFKDPTYAMYSSTGIKNISDLKEPIEILKERLSRANIIKQQKLEFKDIYEKCIASENFAYKDADSNLEFQLILDLLMVRDGEDLKIYIPKSLIGPLLSYTHLLGHLGVRKMLQNLNSYYFDTKYTTIKNFVSSCYPCFLNHGSSRKVKLGNYPIAEFPFEEVSVDLAESLNTVNGLSHLLIVQCILTNFILIYPLKTKTAQEVCKVFLYNVLQSFNVLRIHQDNGPCFRNAQWLKLMAILNIQIVNASANNPSSRGKAERAVGQVKLLMKKFLSSASSDTLNWDLLPFLISKLMNHTVSLQTGFKPAEMIFGRDKMAQAFFDREKLLPVHHSMIQNKESIEKLSQELRNMSKIAQENLIQLRRENHEKINKTRIDKPFKQNDIVFVLDRYNLPGNTRPLKSKFFPSPYVVVKPYFTTCLVRRLADNFTALYSMDDLKLYKGTDPLFSSLPPEVNKVLLHDFQDLIESDYITLLKHDPLDVPTGLQLIDTVDPHHTDTSQIFTPIQQLKDEFYAENPDDSPEQVQPDDPLPQAPVDEVGGEDDGEEDQPVQAGPVTRSKAAKLKTAAENPTKDIVPPAEIEKNNILDTIDEVPEN
jgi:Reverse transcriptase (RNA-dependent DNA polymerase)/RNase H-like domain found in reverse transcriptase/Integrase zinc binding domain